MKRNPIALIAALALFPHASHAEVKVRSLHSMETLKTHNTHDWATAVAHFKGHSYYVTPNSDDRPVIVHVDPEGKANETFLDPEPDYIALPDPHNCFSIGIDEKGYVHVAGDMHQFGANHSRHGGYPYPERYDDKKGAKMLYWRSKRPWDTAAGFEYRGGAGSKHLMPGTSWSYGRFFNDAQGKMFYSARVRAKTARNYQLPDAARGSMGLGLYEYNSATETWSVIGARPTPPDADNVGYAGKVFLWTHSGRMDTKGSYQVYMGHFAFDTKGRLHAAGSTIIGDNNLSRVLYAYSDDRGKTWHRSDGSRIPGLPLRGEDGEANLADVVATMNTTGIVKVVADRHGRPAVKYSSNGVNGWYVRGKSGWICKPTRPDGIPGNRAHILPDANLVFTAPWVMATTTQLLPTGKFEGKSHKGGLYSGSELGALTTGKLYGLRIGDVDNKKIKLTLVEATFTPDEFAPGK